MPDARLVCIRLITDAPFKIIRKSNKFQVEEDPKFQKCVPNTAKVIFALDKKILSISNNSYFCKQLRKIVISLIFMSTPKC